MMTTLEQPIQSFIGGADERQLAVPEGTKLKVSFFNFVFFFPPFIARVGDTFSDSELLAAAEQAGTFDFWDNSQEDIYNDLRK